MEYTNLENKTDTELKNMLNELQVKLGRMRFELANKTLKNVSEIKIVKRDIARVFTALNIHHGK
jgi:large subunit ribosomal protein L29